MYNKRQSFFVKKPFFNISEAKLTILPHKNKRISNKKLKERHPKHLAPLYILLFSPMQTLFYDVKFTFCVVKYKNCVAKCIFCVVNLSLYNVFANFA